MIVAHNSGQKRRSTGALCRVRGAVCIVSGHHLPGLRGELTDFLNNRTALACINHFPAPGSSTVVESSSKICRRPPRFMQGAVLGNSRRHGPDHILSRQLVYGHRTPMDRCTDQRCVFTRSYSSLSRIRQCTLHDAEWFKGPGFSTAHGGPRPRQACLWGPS